MSKCNHKISEKNMKCVHCNRNIQQIFNERNSVKKLTKTNENGEIK